MEKVSVKLDKICQKRSTFCYDPNFKNLKKNNEKGAMPAPPWIAPLVIMVLYLKYNLPWSTTSSTSLPSSLAIKPTIEKMTKPAKILVAQFAIATKRESLFKDRNISQSFKCHKIASIIHVVLLGGEVGWVRLVLI